MKPLALLCLFLLAHATCAADLATAQQALNIISDFADKLCKSPALHGGTQGVELTGRAKAELSEVVKKVVNLGIEGAAKYQSAQYQGVLQQDLANVLKDSSNCRLEVWRDLKDKLVPQVSKPVSPRSERQDPATRVEEENQRLRESARLAKAEAEAEAAIREFAIRNRALVDVTPAQRRTLSALLADNVRAEKIEAYLLLIEAGIGLTVSQMPGSMRRIELVLDAAAQVADGSNVGLAIHGKTPRERIKSLAKLIQATESPKDSRVAEQQVQDLRRTALRYPSLVLR